MINTFAKALVLVQAVLSVAGMSWAIMMFLQSRDLGWAKPAEEVTEYAADGNPKTTVRFASEYDKSVVLVQEAAKTRDRTYFYVKPALDDVRYTERFLAENHLYYVAEKKRLIEERSDQEKKDDKPFTVKHIKDGGLYLDPPDFGKPKFEDAEIAMIKKPYKEYQADLRKLIGHSEGKATKKVLSTGEIEAVELKIQEIVNKTKLITNQLTGTDNDNVYEKPGLYELTEREFKYQAEIKIEIDKIKPDWSKAVEQSRLFRFRRAGLEETLRKLQGPPPPAPKNEKKL